MDADGSADDNANGARRDIFTFGVPNGPMDEDKLIGRHRLLRIIRTLRRQCGSSEATTEAMGQAVRQQGAQRAADMDLASGSEELAVDLSEGVRVGL
ncbi:uncharacterized protein A4U43_C03F31640 [Asparagus officinalis]|uniref:Uncharacterized protein n=1 Tax=Asparagus officinalis TaxID=4686 RepID=A0A5P1FF55_ASPOF|nr:uncharacterized protein A4U43_C03F31640 [Asparagus officinalis]